MKIAPRNTPGPARPGHRSVAPGLPENFDRVTFSKPPKPSDEDSKPPDDSDFKIKAVAAAGVAGVVGVLAVTSINAPEPPPVIEVIQVETPQQQEAINLELEVTDAQLSRPMTDQQAIEALSYLDNVGMQGSEEPGLNKKLLGFLWQVDTTPRDALSRLDAGKPVRLTNAAGETVVIRSRAELQALDSFAGRGHNRVTSERTFEAVNHFEQGLDDNDGFFYRGKKIDGFEAFNRLGAGYSLTVNHGDLEGLSVRSLADLGELDAIHHNPGEAVPALAAFAEFQQSPGFVTRSGERVDGYTALQKMQRGESLRVGSESVFSPSDLLEYKAFTSGQNTILPAQQFEALNYLFGNGAYGALQQLQAGQSADFSFRGGPEGEVLRDRVGSLDDLATLQQKVENQREADQYRLPFETFHGQAQSLVERAGEAGNRAQGRAEGEIRSGESALSRARSMPRTVSERYTTTEWGYHWGYDWSEGEYGYHYGSHRVTKTRQVNNRERDRAISRAESDISSARAQLRAAEAFLNQHPQLRAAVEGLSEDASLADLEALVARLREVSRDSSTDQLLNRLNALLQNAKKPAAPQGWTAPTPRYR